MRLGRKLAEGFAIDAEVEREEHELETPDRQAVAVAGTELTEEIPARADVPAGV